MNIFYFRGMSNKNLYRYQYALDDLNNAIKYDNNSKYNNEKIKLIKDYAGIGSNRKKSGNLFTLYLLVIIPFSLLAIGILITLDIIDSWKIELIIATLLDGREEIFNVFVPFFGFIFMLFIFFIFLKMINDDNAS